MTVLKSMSMLFGMSAMVVSYAMDYEAHRDSLIQLRSSFQRVPQEVKKEEERMLNGKVPQYKKSELEKELSKSKRALNKKTD